MRIVSANKYYFLKGGAERAMFELNDLLRKHGHEVVPFAMQDGKNMPTEWAEYFVSPVRTEKVSLSLSGLKTAGRVIYSFEAARKFDRLLGESKPDIVHIHNIYHQISPSILPKAKKRGIPIVMTAHDYKLIAPNYSLYHDGAICEHTKKDRFVEAVKHRCVKGSRIAGILEALEMTVHKATGLYLNAIDRIITPSAFMKALFEEYGIPSEKLVHVPHFIDLAEWGTPEFSQGEYALYVGRLSEEKGVDVLIRAAAKLPHVPVRIVGTGPRERALKDLAAGLGARNVEFVGFKDGDGLKAEYANARYLVMPSVWYEVFGLTALEAFASGKPVIATQMGGLSELVVDGETGIAVSANDADDLATQMDALWKDPASAAILGRNARRKAELDHSPERHYARIMEVYRSAGAGE
jgi:glycosyltransferase involved in cell wall biosynthesis